MFIDRFSFLLERYMNESATEEEQKELSAIIQEHNKDEGLTEQMQKLIGQVDGPLLEKTRLDSMIGNVLQADKNIHSIQVHRPRFLQRSIFRYAAAVIILLGAGIYFYMKPGIKESSMATITSIPLPKDIAPGKQGAILTLADGSQMVLDSLGNGLVATDNGSRISLKDGQLTYSGNGKSPLAYNTMSTPRGRQFQLILPDGTKVWLNAASSITFPVAFTENKRNVRITGEAYFEVAKDNHKPFSVESGDTRTDVLGTNFNINSYSDESNQKTTLLEGSIKISKENSIHLLAPGQQAIIGNDIKITSNADLQQAVAWKNGAFDFNNLTIREVMLQLARWYDVDVEFAPGTSQKRLGGEMGRNLTLTQVLNLLDGVDMHLKLEGRKILVYQ